MSSGDSCVFCKIVAGEIPCFKLFEDDHTLSFMDINPANPGHCLVIAKAHHPTLYAMPPALLSALMPVVAKVATAVDQALKPDGINLLQANGPGAAQSVLHFHMHILPRYLGDGLSANWVPKPGKLDDIKAIAERIRAALA